MGTDGRERGNFVSWHLSSLPPSPARKGKWKPTKPVCVCVYTHIHVHSLQGVLVSQGFTANNHTRKSQKYILSQSWRPKAGNQGVGRAVVPLEALGEEPSSPLPAPGDCWQFIGSLACGETASASASSSPGLFLVSSVSLGIPSSPYMDTSHGSRAPSMQYDLIKADCIYKGLISK